MRAAIDGPTTRAAFMLTLFSVTALLTSSGPTSSSTKVRRAGVSTTVTKPRPIGHDEHHPELHRAGDGEDAEERWPGRPPPPG